MIYRKHGRSDWQCGKTGIEKGLANQVIESLGVDDFMSNCINNVPHTIAPLSATLIIQSQRQDRSADICGTTHLSPALSTAFEMVRTFNGGKNVIVISDGKLLTVTLIECCILNGRWRNKISILLVW